MSFLRVGDTAAYDQRTLAPLDMPGADDRTVDEVFGFSVRLAAECGGKETDRIAARSMARTLAGSLARMEYLMETLVAAGVWEPHANGWRLVNDTAYLHLLTQEEIENARARSKDDRNDALTVPARLRDGDACRFCGRPVDWADRKSLKGATWEHVDIAVQPTPLDLFVVCCFQCNREPSGRPDLKPPPAEPKYGARTRSFIKKRLGKFPSKAEIPAIINRGLRTSSEDATGRQRASTEDATRKGQWTVEATAATGQRTDAENAPAKPRQRPENASENATATTTAAQPPPPAESPPRPSQGDLAPDQPIRGVTDLDTSGRVGTGSSGPPGPGSARPTVPSPAQPGTASKKRSKRGKGHRS